MKPEKLLVTVREVLGERVVETHLGAEGEGKEAYHYRDPTVVVRGEDLVESCMLCRDTDELGFDLLSSITGCDYLERGASPLGLALHTA